MKWLYSITYVCYFSSYITLCAISFLFYHATQYVWKWIKSLVILRCIILLHTYLNRDRLFRETRESYLKFLFWYFADVGCMIMVVTVVSQSVTVYVKSISKRIENGVKSILWYILKLRFILIFNGYNTMSYQQGNELRSFQLCFDICKNQNYNSNQNI